MVGRSGARTPLATTGQWPRISCLDGQSLNLSIKKRESPDHVRQLRAQSIEKGFVVTQKLSNAQLSKGKSCLNFSKHASGFAAQSIEKGFVVTHVCIHDEISRLINVPPAV